METFNHLEDATILVIRNAIARCHTIDIQKVIKVIDLNLKVNPNVTPILILSLVENVIKNDTNIAINSLRLFTLHMADILAKGQMAEDYLIEQGQELTEENNPYSNVEDLLSDLYKQTTFELSLRYMDPEHKIYNKYKDQMEELNNIFAPIIDIFLKEDVMQSWAEVKNKYTQEEKMFITYQHYALYTILSKYDDFTLSMEQIKEAYEKHVENIVILPLENLVGDKYKKGEDNVSNDNTQQSELHSEDQQQ